MQCGVCNIMRCVCRSVKALARLSLKEPVYLSVHEHAQYSTPTGLEQVLHPVLSEGCLCVQGGGGHKAVHCTSVNRDLIVNVLSAVEVLSGPHCVRGCSLRLLWCGILCMGGNHSCALQWELVGQGR